MMSKRDNFPPSIVRIMADRVGQKCSNPDCRALTCGPQDDESKSVNVGVGAHITAAAVGGPRYDSNLTSEQRKDIGNGIWLCQNCAKHIDNDVSRHPVPVLQQWKTDAEEKARISIGKSEFSKDSEPISLEQLRDSAHNCGALLRSHKHTVGQSGKAISRDVVSKIVEWAKISESELSSNAQEKGNSRIGVLLDGAGMGKTSVARDVMLTLEKDWGCVLAIKSDQQLAGVQIPEDLAISLNLPTSLEEVVSRLAANGPVLVIVDQLDALSLSLSRDQRAMDIILEVVARLKEIPKVRILISCRTFDLHSDTRLRHLAICSTFDIPLLNEEDVRPFIQNQGLDWNSLSTSTRELLRVPLHLDIFITALEKSSKNITQSVADLGYGVTTLQDLYRLLWNSVLRREESGAPPIAEREAAVEKVAEYMRENRKTSAPRSLFSQPENRDLESSVRWLASVGILVEAGNEWAFLHQTFIDFCVAKSFVENRGDLTAFILEGDQSLYARPQMLQTIAYLRGSDPDAYLVQLQQLLSSPSLRQHLKTLLRSWFGALRDPTEGEWRVAQRLLNSSTQRDELLPWMGNNLGWFLRVKKSLLPSWLQLSEDEFLNHVVFRYLSSMNHVAQDDVAELLTSFVGRSDAWNERLEGWLGNIGEWKSKSAVTLLETVISTKINTVLARGEKLMVGNMWSLKELMKFDPAAACRVTRIILDGLLAVFNAHRTESKYPDSSHELLRLQTYSLSERLEILNGSSAHDLFEELPTLEPEEFINQIVPWIERALGTTNKHTESRYHYGDDEIYEIWHGSGHCVRHFIVEGVANALVQLATSNRALFQQWMGRIAVWERLSMHQILVHTFQLSPELLGEEAALYLMGDSRRLRIGDRKVFDSRHLITLISPNLSIETREELQEFLIECSRDVRRWYGNGRHMLKFRGEEELLHLEAFAPELRSDNARAVVRELRRKFPEAEAETSPSIFRSMRNRMALPLDKALKISDRQWLDIFHITWNKPVDSLDARDIAEQRNSFSGALVDSIVAQPQRFKNLLTRLQDSGEYKSLDLPYRHAFMEGFSGATKPLEERNILLQEEVEEKTNQSSTHEQLISPFVAPVDWFFEAVRLLAPSPGIQGYGKGGMLSWAETRRYLAWNLEKRIEILPPDLIDLLESYVRGLPHGEIDLDDDFQKERERLVTHSAQDSHNAVINNERGIAFQTLMRIFDNRNSVIYEERRWKLLEFVAQDPSPVMRVAGIEELKYHLQNCKGEATTLFQQSVRGRPEILRAGATREFIYWAMNGQLQVLLPHIEKMMNQGAENPTKATVIPEPETRPSNAILGRDSMRDWSSHVKRERELNTSPHDDECAQSGAELVCIATISPLVLESDSVRNEVRAIANRCVSGRVPWRLAVANIAVNNLTSAAADECLQWLKLLLNDENEKVRQIVASVFRRVTKNQVNLPPDAIYDFATSFADSKSLFDGLDGWRDFLWSICEAQPEDMLFLLEKSLSNTYQEKNRFYLSEDWMRLALRVYTDPLCSDDWRERALKTFDQLMEQNVGVAQNLLTEWDRR